LYQIVPKNKTLHILFFILITNITVYAQYTGVINSFKPGFSISPYSVGTGVYQFESSLFHKTSKIEPTFSRPQYTGVDFSFRMGLLLEKLELFSDFALQKDKIAFKNIFTSHYNSSGISRINIGAKYLIYEQKYKDKSTEIRSWKARMAFDLRRLIPSIAIYASYNFDALNNIHKKGKSTPRLGILLQNDINKNLNIVSNVYYDYLGTQHSQFSYIVSATYSFTDRWSTFLENQTIFEKEKVSTNVGTGLAYLFNRNFQINGSTRYMREGNSNGIYFSVGSSFRIDNHKDKFKEIDDKGNEVDDPVYVKRTRVGRFFNKVFNIFKRKKTRENTKESVLKNTEVNNKDNQITTDKNKIRKRPTRTRVKVTKQQSTKRVPKRLEKLAKKKEKEVKKEKRKSEKEKRKNQQEIEKEKKRKQKEIDDELRELEKEKKRIEREMAKEAERKKREENKKKKNKDDDNEKDKENN